MIVIATIIHTHAVRVDTNVAAPTKASESSDNPKAEALTLVIHDFPQSKLRPIRVIERSDDVVHVVHSNRPKRKPQAPRKRRPSTNQYRSKIKHNSSPGISSSYAGFRDFTSNDYRSSEFRFPPFPTKNYGEPPRISNKYKYGKKPPSSLDYYGYNAQPSRQVNKKAKKPPQFYGPPPTVSNNQYQEPITVEQDLRPFNHKPLQTLQQQQQNFPSFSIDTVEPVNSNFFNSQNEKFPQPISNFPLESGSNFNTPQKTSYGEPIKGQSKNPNNFNFNPNIVTTNLNQNQNQNQNYNQNQNQNQNFNKNHNIDFDDNSHANSNTNLGIDQTRYLNQLNQNINKKVNSRPVKTKQNVNNFNPNPTSNSETFPKLPSRYEPEDFSTPHRSNPLQNSGNQFLNEYSNFNEVNSPSETSSFTPGLTKNRNRFNNFNKFSNFDYDFGKYKNTPVPDPEADDEDDEEIGLEFLYTTRRTTTTTTPAPTTTTTKRPKKNGFGVKRKRPGKISPNHNLDADDLRDAFTESTDFHEVALSSDDFVDHFDSQRQNKRHSNQYLHEIHSTLKTARNQNHAFRSALGDGFEIVSVQKSVEKDPSEEDPFGFQRKSDNFVVGSDIQFGVHPAPVVWSGDFNNYPKNHRYP